MLEDLDRLYDFTVSIDGAKQPSVTPLTVKSFSAPSDGFLSERCLEPEREDNDELRLLLCHNLAQMNKATNPLHIA